MSLVKARNFALTQLHFPVNVMHIANVKQAEMNTIDNVLHENSSKVSNAVLGEN